MPVSHDDEWFERYYAEHLDFYEWLKVVRRDKSGMWREIEIWNVLDTLSGGDIDDITDSRFVV